MPKKSAPRKHLPFFSPYFLIMIIIVSAAVFITAARVTNRNNVNGTPADAFQVGHRPTDPADSITCSYLGNKNFFTNSDPDYDDSINTAFWQVFTSNGSETDLQRERVNTSANYALDPLRIMLKSSSESARTKAEFASIETKKFIEGNFSGHVDYLYGSLRANDPNNRGTDHGVTFNMYGVHNNQFKLRYVVSATLVQSVTGQWLYRIRTYDPISNVVGAPFPEVTIPVIHLEKLSDTVFNFVKECNAAECKLSIRLDDRNAQPPQLTNLGTKTITIGPGLTHSLINLRSYREKGTTPWIPQGTIDSYWNQFALECLPDRLQ